MTIARGLRRMGLLMGLAVSVAAGAGLVAEEDTLVRVGADGFRHNGITAHRGDQGEAAENTLKAFADAIEGGADWVELDVFTTKDGQIVVSHDATMGRVGDTNLRINDVTYEELKGVDVATSYRKEKGLSVEAFGPVSPPLLKEALELVKKAGVVRVSIQPKDGSTEKAVEMVKEMGMVGRVSFNDGSLAKMRKVKEMEPGIRVHWDRPAKMKVEEDLSTAKKYGFEMLVVERKGLSEEVVKKVKGAGLEVGVWTVDDAAEGRKFLEWGVDRIYTDYPRVMLGVKRELTGK